MNSTKNTVSATAVGEVISNIVQLALTLFSEMAKTVTCPCGNGGCGTMDSVQCNDVACIKDYVNRTCPEALGPSYSGGHCALKSILRGGWNELPALAPCFAAIGLCCCISAALSLLKSPPALARAIIRPKSPLCSCLVRCAVGQMLVAMIAGRCDSAFMNTSVCNNKAVFNETIEAFQKQFPMRYVVGLGYCAVVMACPTQRNAYLQPIPLTGTVCAL